MSGAVASSRRTAALQLSLLAFRGLRKVRKDFHGTRMRDRARWMSSLIFTLFSLLREGNKGLVRTDGGIFSSVHICSVVSYVCIHRAGRVYS
ncbi:hypothetical protein BRADI_1g44565v3 [Brachypodium distachyon]|uniref:Uncharacterized protein n=1 Tax=Brachypodium distachyon TaxID=15368 RepID=A0A2K2DPB8_BRADI|nr:hypothetical protein BRADI_1g44565v3 [Brachypodium distachyon]